MTKHLDSNTKHFEVLLCYNLMKGVIDKKEKIVSIIKPDLFTIGTITLSNLGIFKIVIFNAKINTKDFTFKFMHFERQI